jgi:hypothetical protein
MQVSPSAAKTTVLVKACENLLDIRPIEVSECQFDIRAENSTRSRVIEFDE